MVLQSGVVLSAEFKSSDRLKSLCGIFCNEGTPGAGNP